MLTYSPLIQDGDLVLSDGKLQDAPDIQTQMTVTVAAYNCIYDEDLNSQLIPYLNSIPSGGINNNTISNIIKSAYSSLILNKTLNKLGVAVIAQASNYLEIKIAATDSGGNPVTLSWGNY